MKELTLAEMEDILAQHEISELAQDIEATMTTVAPEPYYEFPTSGWRVDGEEGVREHYRRSLSAGGLQNVASRKRVHGVGPNTLFREAWFSFDGEDGERLTGQYLAVIEFDPETRKIKSERQYSDSIFERFLAPHLGADYGETPGVTRLNANTQPVSRAEMEAEIRELGTR
jgi:hypothetical protein